VQRSF